MARVPGYDQNPFKMCYFQHLKASPLPPAPCQQATADWWTVEMGHFLYRKLSFWRPRDSILVSLVTFLVIQRSTGTPNRHLEVQLFIFIDFWVHYGSLLRPTLSTFCDFPMILGAKVGDSFQVHVFGDPGMEMMPECNGCMCLKHCKNSVFRMMSLLPLIHWFGFLRDGFRWHFGVFW